MYNGVINEIRYPGFTLRFASIDETVEEVNNSNHKKAPQATAIAVKVIKENKKLSN